MSTVTFSIYRRAIRFSVHVIHVGPISTNNEYEYAVMSTNCNYPIYVFARDPVVFKQVTLVRF